MGDISYVSPDMERVINIYGSEEQFLVGNEGKLIDMWNLDSLLSDELIKGLPHVSHKFTRDNGGIDTINIELKGIDHVGYFYDSTNTNPLKVKASDFIAKVLSAAQNIEDLEDYLSIVGVPHEDIPDNNGNRVRTYKVNLDTVIIS